MSPSTVAALSLQQGFSFHQWNITKLKFSPALTGHSLMALTAKDPP